MRAVVLFLSLFLCHAYGIVESLSVFSGISCSGSELFRVSFLAPQCDVKCVPDPNGDASTSIDCNTDEEPSPRPGFGVLALYKSINCDLWMGSLEAKAGSCIPLPKAFEQSYPFQSAILVCATVPGLSFLRTFSDRACTRELFLYNQSFLSGDCTRSSVYGAPSNSVKYSCNLLVGGPGQGGGIDLHGYGLYIALGCVAFALVAGVVPMCVCVIVRRRRENLQQQQQHNMEQFVEDDMEDSVANLVTNQENDGDF